MAARFAHPRGVLADLLDTNPEEIPDRWLRDKQVFALITEYYSPSLDVLRGLENPDPTMIPKLDAVGTTLDKDEYAERVKARPGKRGRCLFFAHCCIGRGEPVCSPKTGGICLEKRHVVTWAPIENGVCFL